MDVDLHHPRPARVVSLAAALFSAALATLAIAASAPRRRVGPDHRAAEIGQTAAVMRRRAVRRFPHSPWRGNPARSEYSLAAASSITLTRSHDLNILYMLVTFTNEVHCRASGSMRRSMNANGPEAIRPDQRSMT